MGENGDRVNRFNSIFICFFAFWVFTVCMGYIAAVSFVSVPEANQRLADIALGFVIGTALPAVVVWGFRTSKSAMDEKHAKLNNAGGEG